MSVSVGDWEARVTGEVIEVERRNVDKSGRAPKYFYVYRVRAESLDGVPAGVTVPDPVSIRIKDVELERLTKRAPEVGDRVVMTGRASGARPDSLYLTAVTASPR
jgi:hypothetical protein